MLFGVLLISTVNAQSIQKYENGQLKGAFKIKLKPELVVSPSGLESSNVSGYSTVGIEKLDQLNIQYQAVKMERLFPYSPKHYLKHQKHGLHLWYKVNVESEAELEQVIKAYGNLIEVEQAEPFYEKSLVPHTIVEAPANMSNTKGLKSTSPYSDPRFDEQWHYHNTSDNVGTPGADINLLKAWEKQVGHPDVIVAVIDQGVDYSHEDLAANMWVNEAELNGTPGEDSDGNGYIDDIYGFDFVNMDGDVKPLNHGTHVAGTVAAVNNNGIGVAGVAGGSGNGDGVRIMSCMIMSDSGAGSAEAAFVYAADNGAVIAQNSWGWNEPGIYEQSILDAIDYFIEEAGQYENSPMKGGLVLFASGNNGDEGEYWPGCYDKVIAVSSTGKDNEVAPYSNYGEWVDITAPGGNVDNGQNNGVLSTMPGDSYGFYDGTSMACPHVSGVAALIVSEYKGANFDNEMLATRLLGGVNVLDTMPINERYVGKVGLGGIDAYLALQQDNGIAPEPIDDFKSEGVSSTFAFFLWTVPVDEDDDAPRYFKLYYSEESFDNTSLDGVDNKRFNTNLSAGELINYELKGLQANTRYYAAVTAIDRWGNESPLSSILEIETNKGPVIELDKELLDFDVDVSVDTLSQQQFNITNTGEGLLKWDVKAHHVKNIDTYSTLEPRKLYAVNPSSITQAEVTDFKVSNSNLISPYAQKPEDRYMHYFDASLLTETLTAIGESNKDIPNSSAIHFEIFNPAGWNLTGAEIGLFFDEAPKEHLYVEVYEGGDISTARLIHTQTFTVDGSGPFFKAIDFDKQMFFKQGDEFFLVFHVPPGYKYPFLGSQGLTLGSTDHQYFSTDQGETWDLLRDVYYDYTKVWDVIALNELVELDTYFKMSPSSGYLNPNESASVDVTVNASQLINGNYTANIDVFGDGYENNWKTLQVEFDVLGQKHQLESSDIVNFGNIFIGENATESITISNVGLGAFGDDSGPLDITIEDADFSLLGSMPRVISGERSIELSFYFAPSKEGAINSKVTLYNTNGDKHVFYLYGAGTLPAKAVLNPATSLIEGLALGEAYAGEFYLANEGDYPLRYFIPKYADGSNMPDFDPNSIHNFGYVAGENVSELGNDAFDWIDIQYTGIDISDNFRFDGSVILEDALLGFSFPYFGNEYDTCYISNQGALSLANNGWFNAKPAGYNSYVQPSKLISAWGMPFDLSKGGKILYQQMPGKFILQYQDVVHGSYIWDDSVFGGVGWLDEKITFQIVLHQNGDIDFNYKDLGDVLGTRSLGFNRASTLIMIEDYDLGDNLVLNGYGTSRSDPFILGTYPATGNQIYFKNPGYGSLQNVTNAFGTIQVGDSVLIEYAGTTEELYVADFEERINIVSNDPINNPVTHTINLNITTGGEANYTFEPGTIDFGNVFEGAVQTLKFVVGNDGRAVGRLSAMSFENGLFEIEGYMPAELRPNTISEYTIAVTADAIGLKEDVLLLSKEDGEIIRIHTKCNVVEAPFISSDKTEIVETLNYGASKTVDVTIENTGLNAMKVTPSANEWLNVLPSNADVYQRDVDYMYTIEHNVESALYIPSDVVTTGDKLKTPEDILDSDSFWMTVPMPFEVNFYGQQYDTLYVGITGIITFVPDQETKEWGPSHYIPNEADVNAFLAPLFGFNGSSDPRVYPNTGIYTKAYTDKFVIRYQDLGSNGGGKPASVEVWIYKNGIIKYMYELEDEELSYILFNGSLVGIENQDGTKGFQVSAKTNGIIKNGTIITFLPEETYTVDAQSTSDFKVFLNAQSLYHGQYTDDLIFRNNTPDAPDYSIPVSLDIIGKDSVVVEDTLSLGQLMMIDHDNEVYTSPYKRYDYQFTLSNNGTRSLFIKNIKLMSGFNSGLVMGDDKKFGTNSAEDGWVDISRKRINYNLKPLDSEAFNLRVTPMQEGLVEDTILVYCDLDNSPLKIPVSAVFTMPPAINIQSDGVHVYADTNEHEEVRSFIIDNNNGSMALDYEVSVVFERNINPFVNTSPRASAQIMPTANITKLEHFALSSVKSVNTYEMEEFNRVLQYEEANSSSGNVGFGSNSMSFTSATGFYAPQDGFNLTHAMTWYAWGEMLDSYVDITILGGSEDYFECEVLHSQRYHHTASLASSTGELITVELDESLYFFSGEKFYIQFTYDEFIGFPQGTSHGDAEVYQRYYFGNADDMFETTESGYGTLGWITRAAEMEAGGNVWSVLNAEEAGNVAAGNELSLELAFNSAYAKQGVNVGSVIFKSNDPYVPETKLPISLTRNKGPQYSDGFELSYSIFESDTLEYQLIAADEEGDEFSLTVLEDKEHFTYEVNGNVIDIVFMPDYNAAGKHGFVVEGIDTHGNTTQFNLNINVADVNRAPIKHTEIGEQVYAIETDDAYTLDLSDYISDPDGDEVVYKISFEESDALKILSTNSTIAFSPVSPGYVYVNVLAEDEHGAKLETGFPVFIKHRTGIDDEFENAVSIYPNPVRDVLNVSLGALHLEQFQIVDVKGSVVQMQSFTNDSFLQTINVAKLESGVYMLKLYTKQSVIIRKFTKQ